MKKLIAMLLALIMVLCLAACTPDSGNDTTAAGNDTTAAGNDTTAAGNDTTASADDTTAGADDAVMTYAEYVAAELESPVCIETYVQATQSWWENKISVYAQSPEGAYFIYEMACSEEDAAKLLPGTKIRVTGYKGEWAGEVEIMDATFEFIEGADTYIATPTDATVLLNTDHLINLQNMLVLFTDMTVKKVEYKNGEPGDDIYVTVSNNGVDYNFCVEVYLTGPDSDVYKAVGELKEGDVIDITGFLYWYEGVNTHIIGVAAAE